MLVLAFLAAAAAGVPPELQAYYRDHNFVYAFSTIAERRLVARTGPTDERLRRVADAMARMEHHVLDLDPGIVYPRPGRPSGGAVPAVDSAIVLRSDVVRITRWQVDEERGEAWVELECLRLEPPAVQLLIAQYERRAPGSRQPEWDEIVGAHRVHAGPLIRTTEMHRWLLTEDGWRRDRATRHFAGFDGRLHVVR